MAQADSKNSITAPVDTTRRRFLTVAAALLIVSSGENMPDDEREGIFGVADALVARIEGLQETRCELWHLAGDVAKEGAA